ncbi:ribonucleoprotein-associated protein [Penicillium sp. DV-2018c]|nr:ribonucleoprotein-associated protein [Penicillium sp. DV-2018c]
MSANVHRVWPLADRNMTDEVLDLLQQASHRGQIKKGMNEVMKSLSRFTAEIVVIAADTMPLELALHLPLVCESREVPYIWVPSKVALGRACGISRPILAASITTNEASDLSPQIALFRNKVDRLAV